MGNFFKSLFSSASKESVEENNEKTNRNQFDVFKYDGVRAQQIGQVAYAIKCYEQALTFEEDYETLSLLASALTQVHELEEALTTTGRMVALEPENLTGRIMQINLLFLLDQPEEVVKECSEIFSFAPDNYQVYFLKGKAEKQLGLMIEAVKDLSKSLELKDDFADAYLLRSETLLSQEMTEQALADVEKVLTLAPEEEAAFLLKGRIYHHIQLHKEAESSYRKVLHLNPFNLDATLLVGELLTDQERLSEALDLYNEAIEVNPDFTQAYKQRAKVRELTGDAAGAAEDLQKVESLKEESEEEEEEKSSDFNEMYKGGIY